MFHHEDHCQGRDQKGTPANVCFWHIADCDQRSYDYFSDFHRDLP